MKSESDDVEVERPKGWGSRHTFVLLGFLGYAVSYAMRFNLSLTIVAMVRHGPVNKTGPSGTFCPPSSNGSSLSSLQEEQLAEFDWSEAEQGLILGSFFWGYFLTQLPGGILAQRYGGKWILGIGLLVAALFTFLTPMAARMGQGYLIGVRVIEGLGEGVTFPAGQVLISKWIPTGERSTLATIIYSGISIGAAVTMLAAGFLIEAFGWDSVFYATGLVSLLWFGAWTALVHENPEGHPRISSEEKAYIAQSTETVVPLNSQPTPWLKIITSLPVMAICMAQTAFAWGLYTLLIELPTYLKTVLHFDIKQNSLTSSSPYLCMFLIGTALTRVGDMLIQKKIVSTLFCRKLCNTIAQWGTALAFIGAAYSGCNTIVTVLCLNLAAGLIGATFGGCLVSSMDIAPNYAGIISGISNSFANICGFAAPYFAGLLISGNPSIEQWRIVFLTAAGLLFIGNLSFIIFGQAKITKWNSETAGDDEDERSRFNDANRARRSSATSFQM